MINELLRNGKSPQEFYPNHVLLAVLVFLKGYPPIFSGVPILAILINKVIGLQSFHAWRTSKIREPSCSYPWIPWKIWPQNHWIILVPLMGARDYTTPYMEGWQYIVYLVHNQSMLPLGWLYATYHLTQEPETTVDKMKEIIRHE